MKYISFIITVGGDTGWRFTNGIEWQSCAGQLLFDAKKFTNETIFQELSKVMRSINKRANYCHTFSDICDNGLDYILPFINETKGVYVNKDYVYRGIPDGWQMEGWKFTKKRSKLKTIRETDEVVPWTDSKGNERCYELGR